MAMGHPALLPQVAEVLGSQSPSCILLHPVLRRTQGGWSHPCKGPEPPMPNFPAGDMGCIWFLLMPCALRSTNSLEERTCIQQRQAETSPFPCSLLVCKKFLCLQVQGGIREINGKGLLNTENPHPAQEVPEMQKAEAGELQEEAPRPVLLLAFLQGFCAGVLWPLFLLALQT